MKQYERIFNFGVLGLCLVLLSCGGENGPSQVEVDPPAAPQNFRAVASNGRVTLTWTAQDGIVYHLHHSTTPGIGVNSGKIQKRRFALTPYIHSGLTNGTTYYYRLTASSSSSVSAPTDEVSATPLAAPQGFTAVALRREVVLSWTAQAGVTYTLFYSRAPGVDVEDTNTMRLPDVMPPYNHRDLTDGVTYYYRLMAVNPSGASDLTAEVLATPIPVAAPRDFTAKTLSQQLRLTWSTQRSVTYDLFFSTAPGVDIEDTNTMRLPNVMPPYHHRNLTDGTTYYYILKVNDALSAGATAASTNEVSGIPGMQISTGGIHTCVVVGGVAKCWGGNTNAQLGNGGDSGSSTPQQVHGLTSRVTQISAGGDHTCAVVSGRALCWGFGLSGQLGNNNNLVAYLPQQVSGFTTEVTQVSAGSFHSCAVVDGGAWCWGWGTSGQLGTGNTNSANTPQPVSGLTTGVTQISAGNRHTCAVVEGGAWCWGNGGSGRLGYGGSVNASTPQQVRGLTEGVTEISVGAAHTCALVAGRAMCWGEGSSGRLGHNEPTQRVNGMMVGGPNADKLTPTQVSGLTEGVTQISTRANHTCAVVEGRALCWGEGDNARLGHGELNFLEEDSVNADKSKPTQVVDLTSGVTQVSGGQAHSCAVTDEGVVCWGRAGNGRLGNNTEEDSSVPASVRGL